MYVCTYVRMYVCIYKYERTYIYIYIYLYLFICMYIYVCVYVCRDAYVCMYLCVYVNYRIKHRALKTYYVLECRSQRIQNSPLLEIRRLSYVGVNIAGSWMLT